MQITDSVGNPLPETKPSSRSSNLIDALANNTFVLACQFAISKGKTVIYDKSKKTAVITDEKGLKYIINQ